MNWIELQLEIDPRENDHIPHPTSPPPSFSNLIEILSWIELHMSCLGNWKIKRKIGLSDNSIEFDFIYFSSVGLTLELSRSLKRRKESMEEYTISHIAC